MSRAAAFLPDRLAVADALVADAVTRGGVPSAVLLIGRGDETSVFKAYGDARLDTVYDLASLTKVVATNAAIVQLIERGKIGVDDPIERFLPPFAGSMITVRHLLTHSSGLPAGGAYAGKTRTVPQIVAEIAAGRRLAAPGVAFRYSDFSYILAGAIVEAVTGKSLDVVCREQVFGPLGMRATTFRPQGRLAARCAPTGPQPLGVVHDPTARALNGVAGNAGLFSTAEDLGRFCRALLSHGGRPILRPQTVALMTTRQSPFVGEARGLGWDLDSAYSIRGALPPGSYGHTGFTGTSLWLDPTTRTYIVLLTNAVFAKPEAVVVTPLRRAVSTAVAAAIPDLPLGPGRVPQSLPRSLDDRRVVRTGLDVLVAENFARLSGKNLGIVCNHTALDRRGRHLADLVVESKVAKIVRFFGPEHGIRGEVDASVGDSVDARTGLPVVSLYNLDKPRELRYRPTPDQLAGIDTLIFDIQDIGARYYTYIATMGYLLEAAAKAKIPVLILDRPNPLGGLLVEGPLLDPKLQGNFTAYHTMPITHGMTVGELAALFNDERKIGARFEVVAMPNWDRRLVYDETGLPWVNPSPNIRNIREAALYPGVGFLEVLPISVGRGTDTPFEILGAPFITDPTALADDLSQRRLPGVSFAPTRFTPTSSVHKGALCGGVQISLWDRRICRPSALGIHLADALARLYPSEIVPKIGAIGRMIGQASYADAIGRGVPPEEIIARWTPDVAAWQKRRAPFLRYG